MTITTSDALAPAAVRTVALAEPVDLVAFAGADGFVLEHDGTGLAGRGVALRIALPGGLASVNNVAATLARLQSKDAIGRPGCGPVAIGALPFDRCAPSTLIVPSVVVGTDGRESWMTTVGPESPEPARRRTPGPDAFSLTPTLHHIDWCALLEAALADIHAGHLDKVVLAREVLVTANQPIDVGAVLERLRALYPSCFVFSVDGFVGASPELLVSRRGAVVRSFPLAGTVARCGDPAVDERLAADLLASAKDRAEHRFVVDDVAARLAPWCTELHVPDAPSIVSLRNVTHLGTPIEGRLRADAPGALGLAALLHPTPAIAGSPRQAALDWLATREGVERGPFGGPVGWVDSHGDGDWVLGIRSALIDGPLAHLYAGVGVVADSDPAAELAETQLKLQALLAALVRP